MLIKKRQALFVTISFQYVKIICHLINNEEENCPTLSHSLLSHFWSISYDQSKYFMTMLNTDFFYRISPSHFDGVGDKMEKTLIKKLSPEIASHKVLVEKELYAYMVPIFGQFYPDFENWYRNKIIPGFTIGERIIYVIFRGGLIYGVSILKISMREDQKNKICSFYISPELQGNKTGMRLMTLSLSEFQSGYPIVITVPEERIFETIRKRNFLSFLEERGFRIVSIIDGRYRPNKKEYILVKE